MNKQCELCTDHGLGFSDTIIHPDDIILKVCNLLGVAVGKVLSNNRQLDYASARYIIADILYSDKILSMSLKRIGRLLGNRDHTTIMHAIKNMRNRCEYDLDFREKYRLIHISLYGTDNYFKYNDKFYSYQKYRKKNPLRKSFIQNVKIK